LSLASLPLSRRQEILASLTNSEAEQLRYAWDFWRRPEQTPPLGSWDVWLYLAGRGAGKTRTAAEWIRERVESGEGKRIALLARTAADARDVMVGGESGLLAVSPPWFRPRYTPSTRSLVWPNGAIAATYSADEPDQLRGPQHDTAWVDELAAFRYPDAWDQLGLGLRLGKRPRGIVSTTPRPTKLIRSLVSDPGTAVTRGATYDNAGNLAPAFLRRILQKYEGTTLGRQELRAEILSETPGALWTLALLDSLRVRSMPCNARRIVVALDPSTTSTTESAECGIVVAAKGEDGHGYVLDDLSERLSPLAWAKRAIEALKRHQADRIVGEVNNGGDLIATVIHQISPGAPYTAVHASRGKITRAEPIAALYEQKRVHHVGAFASLEDQMTNYTGSPGEESPDRMDALVWAMTELFEGTAQLVAPVGGSLDMAPQWKL